MLLILLITTIVVLTFGALNKFIKNIATKGFFQFETIINVLVSPSDSFEYLCYGSTTNRHIINLTVRVSTLVVRIRRLQTSDSDD